MMTHPTPQPDADATTANAATEPVSPTPGPLAGLCAAGAVKLYRVRANGTTRHVPYLAENHPNREVAEWVSDRTDMEGASLREVAEETGLSPATVRRLLVALEITEEIEAGDWDDQYEEGVTALFYGYVDALSEDATDTDQADTAEDTEDEEPAA